MGRRGRDTIVKMMGFEMRISGPNSTNLITRRLEDIGNAVNDYSEPLEEFGEFMLLAIGVNFKVGGRPKWESLAKSTIAQRLRSGTGTRILIRTGRLMRGFKLRTGKRSLAIFNRVFYYPFHQFGAPRANIPAREMVVLLRGHRARLTEIMRKHIGF